MAPFVAILLIALGVVLLLFGKRTFILFAGIGALLGIGLLNILPGQGVGVFGLLVVFGLAVAGGLVGFFVKGLSHIIVNIIGFLAGGSVTLALLDNFGLSLGFWGFLLALVGGVIGWILASRFFDWAIIAIAALVGSSLVVRGLELFSSIFTGWLGTLLWIVLVVVGFFYLSRDKRTGK